MLAVATPPVSFSCCRCGASNLPTASEPHRFFGEPCSMEPRGHGFAGSHVTADEYDRVTCACGWHVDAHTVAMGRDALRAHLRAVGLPKTADADWWSEQERLDLAYEAERDAADEQRRDDDDSYAEVA